MKALAKDCNLVFIYALYLTEELFNLVLAGIP